MSTRSLVYRNILIYRFVMNILYGGSYEKRFLPVLNEISSLPKKSTVLELCFGDSLIAEFCSKNDYEWIGLDLNENFVNRAIALGYNARIQDVTAATLPQADICVMMGSLYHFHPMSSQIISKMIKAAPVVVISEPVINLSSSKGLLGFLARRGADAGKGLEKFRFNTESFKRLLETQSSLLNCRLTIIEKKKKDMIIKLVRNGKN